MYGLIGKMKAVPGQRDALISFLLEGVSDMPGCLSYVVAQDHADAAAIWVTEVWDNSFKPELLRYTNNVADKACHVVGSTTQVGLAQALDTSRAPDVPC